MADKTASVFKDIQCYAGLKEAYVEVTSATASDVLKLATNNVKTVKMATCVIGTTGVAVPIVIGGTDGNELTIGTGPSADALKLRVLYREY